MVNRLLPFLFVSLLAPAAVAQTSSPAPSPAGAYEVVKQDGSPPIAGATTTLIIVPTAVPGVYGGYVSVDKGAGPEPLPGESMVIVGFGGTLPWTNAKGTQGQLGWSGSEWRSTILTGPNAGAVRRLLPL